MAKKVKKIELIEAIICDQINERPNGKYSLIDVYPKDIALNKIPCEIPVSLWLNFSINIVEAVQIDVKISGKGVIPEDIVIPVKIDQENALGDTITVPLILKNIPLPLQGTGDMTISYKYEKTKWKIARSISVQRLN